MPSLLVLGIGNDILSDDGIGPKLVRDLDRSGMPDWVTFSEASLGGLEVLDTVSGYDKVIFIDAMKTGSMPPGTVCELLPADFGDTLHLTNIHDIDFLTALELGKRTGMKVPPRMRVIAIEIIEDRVFSCDLSDTLRDCYPGILLEVQALVRRQVCRSLEGQ